jgi:hypothetical protein
MMRFIGIKIKNIQIITKNKVINMKKRTINIITIINILDMRKKRVIMKGKMKIIHTKDIRKKIGKNLTQDINKMKYKIMIKRETLTQDTQNMKNKR